MNLYIVDYKPNGECVWIPLDELNNYIDRDNYPDKVSGRGGKMDRWDVAVDDMSVRHDSLYKFKCITGEWYKADEVDVRDAKIIGALREIQDWHISDEGSMILEECIEALQH